VEEAGRAGGCAGGGNGGVVDGARRAAGCGGGRESGEGGGRTKEVGRRDAGTVEGITSVSKDASTRLPVKRLGREEPAAERFADAEEALLVAFRGDDLCTVTSFVLDLERVFRGERRDGPGCGAAAGAGARFSGLVASKSRFGGCSTRFEFEKE